MARIIPRFVLATLLSVSLVHAESADPREQARQHYDRGLDLSGAGDYARALQEFLAAYRISPNFAVLYNIGQAYVALGRPSDAAAALEQYLREGKDQIPPDRLAQTSAQLAAQKAQTAEVAIAVDTPEASIRVDGREVGRAPLAEAVLLAPGPHLISVVVADRPEVTRSVIVQAGQHLDLQFAVPVPGATPAKPTGTLRVKCSEPIQVWVDGMRVLGPADNSSISLDAGLHRLALSRRGQRSAEQSVDIQADSSVIVACAEGAPNLQAPITTSAAGSKHYMSTIGYVLGGAGLGLGAAALGHYLWNRGRYEDWKNTNSELSDVNAPNRRQREIDNNSLADSIERASRVTVSLALGGGALLASGSTLIVVGLDSPSKDRQTSGVNVSLSGAW